MQKKAERPLSENVGKNLKELIRKSKFKTQDKFAVIGMNVDPVTVRRWIAHGVKDINTIEKIASVLSVNIDELLK